MSQYSDGWTYQENMLCKYHRLAGHEVVVLTSTLHYKNGELVEDDRTVFTDCNACRVVRLKKRSKGLFGKLPSYCGFEEALESEKPDIIFSHGCQYVDIIRVRSYVRRHGEVRLYVDNHADFSNSATGFLSAKVLHGIIWRSRAKAVDPYVRKWYGVMPSRVDFLRDVYKLPESKLELLVIGADDEMVSSALVPAKISETRKRLGVSESDFLIVTGGKIDMHKQQTLLLMKAVNRFSSAGVKLVVFGSVVPELKEQLEALVSDHTSYIGWIDAAETYDYFAAADLVAFPGRHSVFWEQAAGMGKPMLCKEWKGTHHVDVCGNVRFLTKDSEEEIYNEIARLLDDKTYSAMKRAAEEASRVFSYREIAARAIETARS